MRNARRLFLCLAALVIIVAALGGLMALDTGSMVVEAQSDEEPTATPPTITSIKELMVFLADDDPSIGETDAPVVIVEFSDYLCPYCGKFYLETLPQIMEEYPEQVLYVHRDYPIFGDSSVELALSAGCAGDQDLFWELHRVYLSYFEDMDFEALAERKRNPPEQGEGGFHDMQNYYTEERILEIAEEIGMDLGLFSECMADQRHLSEIAYDYQIGAQIGIEGIPYFIINGQTVSGAQEYELFQQVIDYALAVAAQE